MPDPLSRQKGGLRMKVNPWEETGWLISCRKWKVYYKEV